MAAAFFSRWLLAAGAALWFAATTAAQPRLPLLDSPIIHPDRTVTFNLRAPHAQKVELSGQFLNGNRPMQKDEEGVWSVTVGPVEPNLYPYHFVADGVAVADPSNAEVFPNERFKASLVDVPADEPALHAVHEVPHGEVSYLFYHSKRLNRARPLVVYTPPGYRESQAKYPVLYLVSGTTDTEETWFRAGRANFILDNLIAQQKAVPMVIVMPYGNMLMGTPRPHTPQAADMYRAFGDELLDQIVPLVETRFRVQADRDHRAIAGFSRGGGQSLFTAFAHPDKFGWVASYAAYLTPDACDTHFAPLVSRSDNARAHFQLLWLGVGRDDFLFREATTFEQFLTERNIQHESLVTDGGHTWMNARHYLAETLQKFFR